MSEMPGDDAQAQDRERTNEPPGPSTAPYAQLGPGVPPQYAARRPAHGAYAESYEEFRREIQQQRDDSSESPSSTTRETGPYGRLTGEPPFGAPAGEPAPTGRLAPLPPQPLNAPPAPPSGEFAMRPRLSTPAPPLARPATRAQSASFMPPGSEPHGVPSDLLRPAAGSPPSPQTQPPAPPPLSAPPIPPLTPPSPSQASQPTPPATPLVATGTPAPSGYAQVQGAEWFGGPAGLGGNRGESEAESARGGEHTDTAPSEVPPAPFESDEEPGGPKAFDETARAGRATAFQGTPGFIGTGAFRRPGRFSRIARSGKGAAQPDPGHPYDPGTADTYRPPGSDVGEAAKRQAGDEARADPYDRPEQDQHDRTVTGLYDTATPLSDTPGSAMAASAGPAPATAASMTDDAEVMPAPMASLAGSMVARSETPAGTVAPAATAMPAGAAPAGAAPANPAHIPSGGQPADHAELPAARRTAEAERPFRNDASPAMHPPETSQLFDGIDHNAAVESTSAAEHPPTSEPSFAMYPHESSQFTGSTQPTAAQPTAVVKGRVHIEDTVIEKVAALASQDVSGVAGPGGYATRVPEPARERAGIGSLPRVQGARARIEDRQVWVDVVIVIEYGVVVMDVANAVKANVAHALSHMLGLRVAEVNVSITDVEMPRPARPGAHAVGATEASRT